MAVNLNSPAVDGTGVWCRALRLREDVTQAEIARRAYTSQQVISRVEKDGFVPRYRLRCAIAAALGTTDDFLWPHAARPAFDAPRRAA